MQKLSCIPALLMVAGFFMTADAQLTARSIEKGMARLSDSVYACKYETSNLEYRRFLDQLRAKGQEDLYRKYEVDSSGWSKTAQYSEPLALHYHRHPGFAKYPVVNISYDAAKAYCQWLTDIYHADAKRKFQRVQFVLPTEAEWMAAAGGGRAQAVFPWGNYYLRNKKGQFLCNFKRVGEHNISVDSTGRPVVNQQHEENAALNDRAVYTAEVSSFWPNNYGLYNCSGNVSEMIADAAWTKGGSWNSYGYYVQIRSREAFDGQSSPQVGFRVFMKVIHP